MMSNMLCIMISEYVIMVTMYDDIEEVIFSELSPT